MLEFLKHEPDGVLKIHSLFFNNSILSNYYEPDRVLGVGVTVRNKVGLPLGSHGVYFLGAKGHGGGT